MGRLADATVGDVVRGLARYRPVALTVAAITGLALFLPGGLREANGPDHVGELALGLDPAGDDEDDARAGAGGEPADEATGGVGYDGADPATSLAVPPPPGSFRRSPPATPQAVLSRSSTPTVTTTTTTAPAPPAFEQPLRLRAWGWATARAGTPLATAGVPDGTLPVGSRVGDIDKASFVRLSGAAAELVLAEDPEGRRAAVAGDAAVLACRVTEPGWAPTEGQSLDEAPAWDPTACVAGERGDDGTWVFDLSGFTDVTDERGFALVPADDAALDFQVAFANQAVG